MSNALKPERITNYCAQRLPALVDTETYRSLTQALVNLSANKMPLPIQQGRIIYSALSLSSGLAVNRLRPAPSCRCWRRWRVHQTRRGAANEVEPTAEDEVTPPRLLEEIEALLAFKTTAFVPIGWQRNGVWNAETAAQKRVQLGQMFHAFSEMGIKPHALSLGLLVLPQVWDLWLRWREGRRGFYVADEADFLRLAEALARPGTGWLRQSPQLGSHLRVVKGLLKRDQIAEVRDNWAAACDRLLIYARGRALDIRRVARIHRDPFEPILAVLEVASPIGEYRKICDEIERRLPDAKAHPVEAAEAVRSLLMLRLGLHLGLRQKNLHELLLCPRGRRPTPERKLEGLRRGELPKDKSALAAQIINKVWLETPSRPSTASPDMALTERPGRGAF